MKRKEDYIVRNVAGKYVIMPVGDESFRFSGIISTNESGAFLWDRLAEDADEDALIEAMLSEYDVDKETAAADVHEFVISLQNAGLLE